MPQQVYPILAAIVAQLVTTEELEHLAENGPEEDARKAAFAWQRHKRVDRKDELVRERETMEEAEIEQAIQATQPTGPRLTPGDIDARIIGEQYYRFPETTVTVCCLTLENGYCVVGESAVLSEENFDEAIGRQVARAEARNKIWALEGYRVKQRMHDESTRAAVEK